MARTQEGSLETQPGRRNGVGTLAMPHRRGLGAGIVLVILGIWGAIIPLVGPYFDYRIDVTGAWVVTWDRWWLSILPGIVVIIGGLVLIIAADRLSAVLGAWLALAAGVWFLIGPSLAPVWGSPVATNGVGAGSDLRRFFEQLGMFYGLGAVVVAVAAGASTRVLVRSRRDAMILATPAEGVAEVVTYPDVADQQMRSGPAVDGYRRGAVDPRTERPAAEGSERVMVGPPSGSTNSPVEAQPTVAPRVETQPAVGQPRVAQPSTAQPGAQYADRAVRPDWSEPSGRPVASYPSTEQPDMAQRTEAPPQPWPVNNTADTQKSIDSSFDQRQPQQHQQ